MRVFAVEAPGVDLTLAEAVREICEWAGYPCFTCLRAEEIRIDRIEQGYLVPLATRNQGHQKRIGVEAELLDCSHSAVLLPTVEFAGRGDVEPLFAFRREDAQIATAAWSRGVQIAIRVIVLIGELDARGSIAVEEVVLDPVFPRCFSDRMKGPRPRAGAVIVS